MDRKLGNVGTKLLLENDRVAIWELRLAPGAKEGVHEHTRDHVLVQISGDRVAADFEPDCAGTYAPYAGTRYEAEVTPGQVFYANKGGIEAAVNTGDQPYFEIIIELKD
jgi:predicted metal-dependent enzyme (double-stranded beta helix superfamily)